LNDFKQEDFFFMKLTTIFLATMLMAASFQQTARAYTSDQQKAAIITLALAAIPSYWGKQKNRPWAGRIVGFGLGMLAGEIFFSGRDKELHICSSVVGVALGDLL
jgi:hypothetical protein